MPSNLLTADTMFPNLTKQQSTDEKFVIVAEFTGCKLAFVLPDGNNIVLDREGKGSDV